jgi:hypothetical protein
MQWDDPVVWAGAAGTSSAPLTNTNGGDGKRFYDQVVLRGQRKRRGADLDAARNRPTGRETGCALYTKPEGAGPGGPLEYRAQLGEGLGITASSSAFTRSRA